MPCPTYLFAGGGSGGHLSPGIAVAEEIRRRSPAARIVFAGSDRPVERELLGGTDFEHVAVVRDGGRSRRIASLAAGTFAVSRLLRRLDPVAVIGLGGWASVPGIVAATALGRPILLLEQNAVPGRATRLCARAGHRVAVACEEAARRLPGAVVTGNPVRAVPRAVPDSGRPHLLVLGGSQGSRGLNRFAVEAITRLDPDLRPTLRVTHQTGRDEADVVAARYAALGVDAAVAPFLPDVTARFADATLCLTRAGATTLTELAHAGLPAVCVPIAEAADDHQRANARRYADAGAAFVVEEGRRDAAVAADLAARLLTDRPCREAMADAMRRLATPDAASRVVDLLGVASDGRTGTLPKAA